MRTPWSASSRHDSRLCAGPAVCGRSHGPSAAVVQQRSAGVGRAISRLGCSASRWHGRCEGRQCRYVPARGFGDGSSHLVDTISAANSCDGNDLLGRSAYRASARGEDDFDFVRHFRSASPYIAGHRGCTFVIVLPGEVLMDKEVLVGLVDDIAMLHGMGIKLVLVLGAQPQINRFVRMRGRRPRFINGYRITDELSMEAAMEAAGSARVLFEALLSKGPSVPMVRRHSRTTAEFHYAAAMRVVSGNHIAARRRGVVHGVDYGYTGIVRFVDGTAIREQLNSNNVVLLSNLGYSAAGELLNCNTFDVALHTALNVKADKLFCMHLAEVAKLRLPSWLSLSAAEKLLTSGWDPSRRSLFVDTMSDTDESSDEDPTSSIDSPVSVGSALLASQIAPSSSEKAGSADSVASNGKASPQPKPSVLQAVRVHRDAVKGAEARPEAAAPKDQFSFSTLRESSFPPAVMACYEACRNGVKRAHLVDARIDGGLLLELYSRDGVGTMLSSDFYEGIRRAGPLDVPCVKELLAPLEEAGIVVRRSTTALTAEIESFIVIERESRVLACAQLKTLGASENGTFTCVGEVAAFCVAPEFRGTGRGDSLLDWIEQDARTRNFDCLVLLTTRTADWFQARDFRLVGPAHKCLYLPSDRRARIDPRRNSQLYAKRIEKPVPGMEQPGQRIGF